MALEWVEHWHVIPSQRKRTAETYFRANKLPVTSIMLQSTLPSVPTFRVFAETLGLPSWP